AATWTFAVGEVYKGGVTEFQALQSPNGVGCGLSLQDHATYLVFADGLPVAPPYGLASLSAESCGGTRSIEAGPLAVEGVSAGAPLPGGVDPATVAAVEDTH